MTFENIVRSCLYNWLGYGNPNGRVWFIGMEEGGAEIWRHHTKTLEDSLRIRSAFYLAMDFRKVWEELYHIPLESFVNRRGGLTVWHFMAAFLLSLDGVRPTTENIRDFVFASKQLGGLDSDHFLCEFLPLPRQSHDSIQDYEPLWSSVGEYHREVTPHRFRLIEQTIASQSSSPLVVSYDKSFTSRLLSQYQSKLMDQWMDARSKQYSFYSVSTPSKVIPVLSTPFFGQGQCNYNGLYEAAQRLLPQLE
jgi:hypothetical protein